VNHLPNRGPLAPRQCNRAAARLAERNVLSAAPELLGAIRAPRHKFGEWNAGFCRVGSAGWRGASGTSRRFDDHGRKVERIADRLRRHSGGRPVSLRKRSVSHQVPKAGDLRHFDEKIDISDLDQILEIDEGRRVCVAEPGVTFVDLVDATLRHGLVPIRRPRAEDHHNRGRRRWLLD